jgi:ornithine--oxo-acid transaminase
MMCVDWDDVRPDMLVMGKSMSGGMVPVSGVVADDFIMKHIGPGDHGSTYGGNPLAMATSMAAVKTLIEEGMIENSEKMGAIMKKKLQELNCDLIKEVRGVGLFIGVEIKADAHVDGNTFAKILKEHGLLTKATHDSTVRLTPPLVITESEVNEVVEILAKAALDLVKKNEQLAN